jgi:uncharacterized membrane protein
MSDNNKNDKFAAKRAAVTGKKNGKSRTLAILGAVVALGVFGAFMVGGKTEKEAYSPQAAQVQPQPAATAQVQEVVLPVSEFEDGKAHFYKYVTADGLAMRYFILKSSDGVIRSALDACDACWQSGKGYHQEGDEMVCNNCRMRFASTKIMEVKGGCNPSPLKRVVVDGKVRIKFEDIEEGRKYFELGQKG